MLSLCMIVKNEEDNLKRCLDSIYDIVDEIIIVDTGSTDSTVEIAKNYTKQVYFFKWVNDFSKARNFSLEKAKGDWILLLDADDEVPLKYKNKILGLIKTSAAEGYFFKTINFLTSSYDNKDVISNSNFRLFRNNADYRFTGKLHEQLAVNIKSVNPKAILKTEDIEIYHYGYLNENVEKKQKRERNMSILQEEITDAPENPFVKFNLANEYYSLQDYNKAIPLYLDALSTCDPYIAYYTKIIIRLVLSYMEVKLYDEAYNILNTGLTYYSDFSDLYYLRSLVHLNLSRPTLAIKDLENCISLGEPNQEIAFLSGVASYRSYEKLANIYDSLEDYENCLKYSMETLKSDNTNTLILYSIFKCLYKLKTPENIIEKNISIIFKDDFENIGTLICHILTLQKDYNLALKYCNLSLQNSKDEKLLYLKGFCEFKLCDFEKALNTFSEIESEDSKKDIFIFVFLIYLKLNNSDGINNLLNADTTYSKICSAYYKLLNNEEVDILSSDENNSASYTKIILLLLDTLLDFKEYDDFEKGLQLLNLIEDSSILLKLGKLYYKHEKFNLSKKELLRSINIFNVIDAEGIDILNKLYARNL